MIKNLDSLLLKPIDADILTAWLIASPNSTAILHDQEFWMWHVPLNALIVIGFDTHSTFQQDLQEKLPAQCLPGHSSMGATKTCILRAEFAC